MKNKISAVVLTHNEAKNIEKCIKSLLWCDEIIVIDDQSSDKTLDIIHKIQKEQKKLTIVTLSRPLNNNFAAQRNFGLSKTKNDWILFIDADEAVPEELKNEIEVKLASEESNQINGYFIRRKDYFLGKWLKYGETGNIKFLRLARKDKGKWQGIVHEVWSVDGNISSFQNPIHHYSHDSVSQFLTKINQYSDIVAQHWKEQGRRSNSWEIVAYPFFKFIYNYFLKLGFLDGSQGFIMAAMMSFHSFLVRSKVYLFQNS